MKRHYQKSLTIFLGLLAILLGLAALFVWRVDPYAVYGVPLVRHFNANKPELHKNLRFVKAVRLQAAAPAAIWLGTSRAEYGLDFDHPGWRHPPFNAAISGAGAYEIMRFLQHAVGAGQLEQVVLSLDFFAFNARIPNRLADLDDKLALLPDGQPQRWPQLAAATLKYRDLLSLDQLKASFDTVKDQGRTPRYFADLRVNDASVGERIAEGFGHRWAFKECVHSYMAVIYRDYSFASQKNGQTVDTLDCLRTMIRTAHARQVDLRAFITPSHAWQLETIRAVGLWPQFEEWKRQLVAIFAEEAAAAGQSPYPLWDFFDYNSVNCEPVPSADQRQYRMRYYLESSHFTKPVGRFVLDNVLATHTPGEAIPADFGVPLTPANLAAHLAAVNQRGAAYRAAHPDDLADIAALSAKTANRTAATPAAAEKEEDATAVGKPHE